MDKRWKHRTNNIQEKKIRINLKERFKAKREKENKLMNISISSRAKMG